MVEGAAPEGGALCTRGPTKLWAGGGASSDGHSFLNLIIKQNNQPPLRYLISAKKQLDTRRLISMLKEYIVWYDLSF